MQNSPLTKQQFAAQGADVVQMTSADFGTFVEKEMNKWEKVVKQSGMKAE